MRDIRGEEVKEYPLVKVGTQYWMQEDLQTTFDCEGNELEQKTEQDEGSAYYHPEDTEIYFYNEEAVLAGNLIPKGWKIPTSADWEAWKNYIQDDVSVVKTGLWEPVGGEGESAPVNNMTGLGICSQGMWSKN